jgi:hypothetical protein
MRFTNFLLFGLLLTAASSRAALSPEQINRLPAREIEQALPAEHPAPYYLYAGRLFGEGRKDDAVFWFYVGQLRYRFHLMANPGLSPSGDPALFASLGATVGQTINEYAGGNVNDWVKAMDRALKWDADHPNGFTSKKKFGAIHDEIRAGLKKMRNQVKSQADMIREQRKKRGLENRG